MSRVGREPVPIPAGVKLTLDHGLLSVQGKLGQLEYHLPKGIEAQVDKEVVRLTRSNDTRQQRALHGLARALTANMVMGVSQGFSKDLEIVGVGYRIDQMSHAVGLWVGLSHKVVFIPPEGINIKVTSPTTFTVSGIDRQLVGDIAAKLRAIRPPEPYKGKGIRYVGEYVRRKAGKTVGA